MRRATARPRARPGRERGSSEVSSPVHRRRLRGYARAKIGQPHRIGARRSRPAAIRSQRFRSDERYAVEGQHTLYAVGVTLDVEQALPETDNRIDAAVAMREYDAVIADGKPRHPGDGHADAVHFTAEKIEHFDDAGRAVNRIGDAA